MASGSELVAHSVSSLSLRMAQSFSSPFIGHLPALAYLGHEIGREFFGSKGQGLSLVLVKIVANEKTGSSGYFRVRHQITPVAGDKLVSHPHDEIEFRRREHVSPQRPGR